MAGRAASSAAAGEVDLRRRRRAHAALDKEQAGQRQMRIR